MIPLRPRRTSGVSPTALRAHPTVQEVAEFRDRSNTSTCEILTTYPAASSPTACRSPQESFESPAVASRSPAIHELSVIIKGKLSRKRPGPDCSNSATGTPPALVAFVRAELP